MVFMPAGTDLQRNPSAFLFAPEAFGFQVGIETPFGLFVRVGDVVADLRHLTRDFTNFHTTMRF